MEATEDNVFGQYIPNAVFHSTDLKVRISIIIDYALLLLRCPLQEPHDLLKAKVHEINSTHESNDRPQNLENVLLFERSLQFIQYFGIVMGVNVSYDWEPGILFAHSLFQMFTIASQIIYTQYLHFERHNYYKMLESLACYGITISVKNLSFRDT